MQDRGQCGDRELPPQGGKFVLLFCQGYIGPWPSDRVDLFWLLLYSSIMEHVTLISFQYIFCGWLSYKVSADKSRLPAEVRPCTVWRRAKMDRGQGWRSESDPLGTNTKDSVVHVKMSLKLVIVTVSTFDGSCLQVSVAQSLMLVSVTVDFFLLAQITNNLTAFFTDFLQIRVDWYEGHPLLQRGHGVSESGPALTFTQKPSVLSSLDQRHPVGSFTVTVIPLFSCVNRSLTSIKCARDTSH